MDPESAPGSEAGLFAFYDLVPAAEHEDLAEQARVERWLREGTTRHEETLFPDDDLPVAEEAAVSEDDPGDAEDDAPVLSEAALIAMLEHRLGARPVDE